jgi:hypothetical protein
MSPNQHVATSIGAGVLLGLLMRSWVAGLSCFLAGVLVDLDHLLDFWLNRGFSLSPKKFFDFCYFGTTTRFLDILHGYEFIPLLVWVGSIPGCLDIGWGVTTGYTLHLLGDQFFNTHLNRWTYFFSYRLFHGFSSAKIVLFNPFVRQETPQKEAR